MKKLILLILFLPLIYLFYNISPISYSSDEIRFMVPLDEKKETTVNRLKEENIIRNEALFNFIAAFSKINPEIEPGAYILKKNFWLPQIVTKLLYEPYQKWVILRPGLRREQITEILEKKFNWDVLTEKEFLDNAPEGYLFPDTYLLNVDYSGKEFAQKLINNFNEKFDSTLQKDLLARDVRNDTAIKIASLIERESGSREDKALIAGIIWNRLNDDMRLQIDATTQYIIGTRGDWWPKVKPENHKSESLYNTYLHIGLPPRPISNPSLDSIKAVVYPEETDCIYYIHDSDKQIHCSKTYEGHLENINKYLK